MEYARSKRRIPRRLKAVIAALVIAVVVAIGGFEIWAHVNYPTTSARNVLSDLIDAQQHPHASLSGSTEAFLPYWRLGNIAYARYDLLSEVNYFGLTIGADGHVVETLSGQTEPGWAWWNTQQVKDLLAKVQISGCDFGLTLSMLNNSDIEAFLGSSRAWQAMISDSLDQIHARHLNDITLDFEYSGTPPAALRGRFTDFARIFSSAVRQHASGVNLALALPPLAGRERGLFDLPSLTPLFDQFIGMSYDYNNASSDVAGPDAPMRGFAAHKFFFDVSTTYADFQKLIPANKIVMGIPYYGWDWAVRQPGRLMSRTLPSTNPNSYAAVLSYGRMRTDANLKHCRWNSLAQETECWYFAGKTAHEVWVENLPAIAAKYHFAKTHNFAGVAIWVLGYDSKYPDLWSLLERTFRG